jgi:deoxyribodipyrimidine photolyase-like uncharacterized protein
MNKLRLILGDQLNINHSWFKENNSKNTYVMMESQRRNELCASSCTKDNCDIRSDAVFC